MPEFLPEIEAALIEWFNPRLNDVINFLPIKSSKCGLRNRVKQFLKERGLTAYRFIKDTRIAPTTGYKLAKDANHLPSITVLEAICDRYEVQPTAFIYWTDQED